MPLSDCHVWPAVWSLLPPHLLTNAVLGVARAAVAAGEYSRLPILADALEEAGCDRADVLAHLRRPGPHEAGCWALHQIVLTDRPYKQVEPPLPPPPPKTYFGPLPGLIGYSDATKKVPSTFGKVTATTLFVGFLLLLFISRCLHSTKSIPTLQTRFE